MLTLALPSSAFRAALFTTPDKHETAPNAWRMRCGAPAAPSLGCLGLSEREKTRPQKGGRLIRAVWVKSQRPAVFSRRLARHVERVRAARPGHVARNELQVDDAAVEHLDLPQAGDRISGRPAVPEHQASHAGRPWRNALAREPVLIGAGITRRRGVAAQRAGHRAGDR